MLFVTSTMHCLLSVHFFCWFEAILASCHFQGFPTENYHLLDFPIVSRKTAKIESVVLIFACRIVSFKLSHFLFVALLPLIRRNMSEDWNPVTFQAKQNFLMIIASIFISVWSVFWVGLESGQKRANWRSQNTNEFGNAFLINAFPNSLVSTYWLLFNIEVKTRLMVRMSLSGTVLCTLYK